MTLSISLSLSDSDPIEIILKISSKWNGNCETNEETEKTKKLLIYLNSLNTKNAKETNGNELNSDLCILASTHTHTDRITNLSLYIFCVNNILNIIQQQTNEMSKFNEFVKKIHKQLQLIVCVCVVFNAMCIFWIPFGNRQHHKHCLVLTSVVCGSNVWSHRWHRPCRATLLFDSVRWGSIHWPLCPMVFRCYDCGTCW